MSQKKMENKPLKILVITVSSWNSKIGANTWASILKNYKSENIANICIRNEIPDSKVCSRYFIISENKILKSIFKRKVKTGQELSAEKKNQEILKDLKEHNLRYEKLTKKRSTFKLLCRELIWKFGCWKTEELNAFLDDFKPDLILHSMEGYIHLNKIIEYAILRTNAKAIGYIWDDNFTYKQSSKLGYKIYRFFQRKSLQRLAAKTQAFFAITEKTKREADKFFKVNCRVLSKPLNSVPTVQPYAMNKNPLRMLYTGNLLIGRDKTLEKIIQILKKINSCEEKIVVDIYTKTKLDEVYLRRAKEACCVIHPPILQEQVFKLQKETDILLFLEDIENKNLSARLSFSTKITDYFSAGKCIFAVGNRDLAPMEYFEENKAALVSHSEMEIEKNFEKILSNRSILNDYARNAAICGLKNHSEKIIFQTFNEVITSVCEGE